MLRGRPSPEGGLGHGRGTEDDGQGGPGAPEVQALMREGAAALGPWGGPCPAPRSSLAPGGLSELRVPGVIWAGRQAPAPGHRGRAGGIWAPAPVSAPVPVPHPGQTCTGSPACPTHTAPDGHLSLGAAGRPLHKSPPNSGVTQGWGQGVLKGRAPPTLPSSPPDGVSAGAAHTQEGGGGCRTTLRAAGFGVGLVRVRMEGRLGRGVSQDSGVQMGSQSWLGWGSVVVSDFLQPHRL